MGFLQALTGLDVADDSRDATSQIVHSLLQGLLGSPDFETYMDKDKSYPFGMILYYVRCFVSKLEKERQEKRERLTSERRIGLDCLDYHPATQYPHCPIQLSLRECSG